jgi:hypothetical protein
VRRWESWWNTRQADPLLSGPKPEGTKSEAAKPESK